MDIETKIKKYQIDRIQHVQDHSISNIVHQMIGIAHQPIANQCDTVDDELDEKKTEKMIKSFSRQKMKAQVNTQRSPTRSQQSSSCVEVFEDKEMTPQILKIQSSRRLQKSKLQQNQGPEDTNQKKIKAILSNVHLSKMKKHFYSQVRKNSIFRTPVSYEPFQDISHDISVKGLEINRSFLNFCQLVNIAHTISVCFIATLFIAFQEKIINDDAFKIYEIFSFLFLISEIAVGFVRVKTLGSKKVDNIRQIAWMYLRSNFLIDLICLIAVLICLISPLKSSNYLLAFFFLKIPQCVEKFGKMETRIFDSFYMKQYWGLLKILSTNFVYAHFLAILLVMMSSLDEQKNWMTKANIGNDLPWYEQYSWSYYWGTTIMLTVGFGDLSASNYKQAICLIFIETISCMAFAYNINCVGNLLKELRSGQIEKQKNLKILRKLCQKNQINSDLHYQLSNHVKQRYKIQTKFNFQEQTQLIQKLPINLRNDFLRACNYKSLKNLTFLKNFTNKAIVTLAQKIQSKICHPNEVVCGVNWRTMLIILKQGELGMFPFHTSEKYSKTAIDNMCVKQKQQCQLVSLDFLHPPIIRKYEIRSIGYSQVFQMQIQTMLSILKGKCGDIQFFFSVKDKQKTNLDLYQVLKCKFCDSNHTKFRCPKLHFMPISQKIIFKYLKTIQVDKNSRMIFKRNKNTYQALLEYKRRNQEFGFGKKIFSICDLGPVAMSEQSKNIKESKSSHASPLVLRGRNGIISIQNIYNKQQQSMNGSMGQQGESQQSYQKYKYFNQPDRLKSEQFIKSAADLVKKSVIDVFLNQKKGEAMFWAVEIDQAKDYKYYFKENNPNFLQELQAKIQNKKNAMNVSKTKSKAFSANKTMHAFNSSYRRK